MNQIGSKLKELRGQHSMTQKDLSELLHVSPQAVSRWENDEVEPSFDTLEKISQIFSVSMDQLFGKTPPRQEAPEPEVRYVEREHRPVLGVCEVCNKPIYDTTDIKRENQENGIHVFCKKCHIKKQINWQRHELEEQKSELFNGWLWGILAAAVPIIILFINIFSGNFSGDLLGGALILSATLLAFIFCLFLSNNFIADMWLAIASWSIRFPGLIFTFDFDGIMWLIGMRILFAVLGFFVSVFTFLFACAAGLALSIFVFPYAVVVGYKEKAEMVNKLKALEKSLAH